MTVAAALDRPQSFLAHDPMAGLQQQQPAAVGTGREKRAQHPQQRKRRYLRLP